MVMDSLITHIPKNREPLKEIKRVSDVVPLANTKVLHKNTAKSVMTVIPLKLKIPTVGSETTKTKQPAKNIETPLIRMEHVISEEKRNSTSSEPSTFSSSVYRTPRSESPESVDLHDKESSSQSLFDRMASELEGEDIEIKISKCLDVLKEAIVSSVSDEIERSRLAYEQTATELQCVRDEYRLCKSLLTESQLNQFQNQLHILNERRKRQTDQSTAITPMDDGKNHFYDNC
ncbi:unnamed protein product [Oikopleura dioica]|uniref:Uncharacterized protein n=1 Tax=Oikopleura dioica TaxID=34765 RepID=E4WYE7_OIKDI|nr:unnamed protein product [Oikopleura dioica]